MAVAKSPSTPFPTGNERVIETISARDKSCTTSILEPPPGLNASALLKMTYHAGHPQVQLGKKYPENPIYHLHFSQAESFIILSGRLGSTTGYDVKDSIWTRANTLDSGKAVEIPPLEPHTFWPVPRDYQSQSQSQSQSQQQQAENEDVGEGVADEDTVILLWAHPNLRPGIGDGGTTNSMGGYTGGDMDYVFFRSLLLMVSDIQDGKLKGRVATATATAAATAAGDAAGTGPGLSTIGALAAVMALLVASDTCPVILPQHKWLGPLRWYLPWTIQRFVTVVWTNLGGRPDGLVQAYVPSAQWERLEQSKTF